MPKKNILITGGYGFVGTNLLLKFSKKYNVYIIDNFYKKESYNNFSKYNNLCTSFNKISITNSNKVEKLIKDVNFDTIINLAAQVAMTKSVEDPINDFRTNVIGTINLLESIRKFSLKTKFINISSNKVYGDINWDNLIEKDERYDSINYPDGYDENTPLDFSGPYGCSKGSAEQYVLNYSKIYEVNAVSFRLSTIYGSNQYSTYDQGWIGWFAKQINENHTANSYTLSFHGNGKQVRDVLHVDDFVSLIENSIENFQSINGQPYNIGGGKKNTLSIIELINLICKIKNLEKPTDLMSKPWRMADQKYYCSKISKIENNLNWTPKIDKEEGISKYYDWLVS